MYYVYILSDQGVPFYVGKGKGGRAYVHERIIRENLDRSTYEFGLKQDYNPHKTRKIKKIIQEGRDVEYTFPFESKNEKAVLDEEKRHIALYGRVNEGGILCNIHPGGTGGDIWSGLSDERKNEIREKKKGRKVSKETKEKIRAASTGRKHTKETREKIRAAKLGKQIGPSSKKGIPATGNNAKGVRKAWNKDLKDTDPRVIAHRDSIQQFHKENPNVVAERCGLRYSLFDPNGNLVEGVGVRSLVTNYNVSYRIAALIQGKVDIYKGWTRAEDTASN